MNPMREIRRLLVGGILFLLGCGSSNYDRLSPAELLEYLPDQLDAVILLPSHEQTTRHLFTIFVHFFGKDALEELKSKLFHNLMNESGLDLLSSSSLSENGIALNQPFAFAYTRQGGVYLSVPLVNPEKAERFATGFSLAFSNHASRRIAVTPQLRCFLSQNRLHILSGGLTAGTKETSWTNLSARIKQASRSLIAIISANNRLIRAGLLPLSTQSGRSLITLTRSEEYLEAEISGSAIALDLLAPLRSRLPRALQPGRPLGGQGMSPFFSRSDLAGASLVLNLHSFWNQVLRPILLREIRRSTRALDNPLTRLLAGGRPLEERILGMLDVENTILGNLTGRVGFVLRSLKNFSILSLSPARLGNALDGVLILETPRASAAQALIKHIAGFSALPTAKQLEITQSIEAGVPIVSFSTPRFRLPDIHVAAVGRYILLGVSKPALASFAAAGERRNAAESVFSKQSARLLETAQHDTSLFLSPAALFSALTGTLDAGTRRNLQPFATQIHKASLLSLIQFRSASETRILAQCILSAKPAEQDPFEDGASFHDPVLWILALILAGVFLTPLVLWGIRRYRNR